MRKACIKNFDYVRDSASLRCHLVKTGIPRTVARLSRYVNLGCRITPGLIQGLNNAAVSTDALFSVLGAHL